MVPVINFFGRQITIYGIMAVIGIAVIVIIALKIFTKRNEDYYQVVLFFVTVFIFALIGAHILYGLTNINLLKMFLKNINKLKSFEQAVNFLAAIFGGAVFYGGLIGGIIGGLCFIKIRKRDIVLYGDVMAFLVPLFHGFGRIGCFLGGCCYGIESKFGFVYHHSLSPGANGVSRFPIQLVEASVNFIICFVLYFLFKNKKLKGNLFCIYLILYSCIRFIDEFFRGDNYRGFIFGLSTSQFISIILFASAIICLVAGKLKSKNIKQIE